MNEKISDQPIREEKIKRLKEKILKEIEEELERGKRDLTYDLTNGIEDEYEFERTISIMHYLYKLREFVNWEHSFNTVYGVYPQHGTIVYAVSMREIDIWLQEKYNFVSHFLFNIDKEEFRVVEEMLSDDYFGIHFTSIFDRIAYDEKQKNKKGSD